MKDEDGSKLDQTVLPENEEEDNDDNKQEVAEIDNTNKKMSKQDLRVAGQKLVDLIDSDNVRQRFDECCKLFMQPLPKKLFNMKETNQNDWKPDIEITTTHQRLVILCFKKQKFDMKNKKNLHVLKSLRDYVMQFLPEKTKLMLEITKSDIFNNDKIFQRDLYEAIGFQNGHAPETDLRAIGFIGLLIVVNLFTKIEIYYKEANLNNDADKQGYYKGKSSSKLYKLVKHKVLKNMLIISSGSQVSNYSDGFPFMLVLLNIIERAF